MIDIKIGELMGDDSGAQYEIRKDKPDYFKMENGLYAVRIDNDDKQDRITELEKQQEAHDSMIILADERVNSAMNNLNLVKQSNAALLRANAWLKNKLSEQ